MKLEFLDNISNNGTFKGVITNQLVRLYDFDTVQADNFRAAILQKLIKNGNQFNLNQMDYIEAINCTLTLRISALDLGIKSNDKSIFFCDLTKESYEDMTKLIEPFCDNDLGGYQWLYDIDTPIEFLFSPGGEW